MSATYGCYPICPVCGLDIQSDIITFDFKQFHRVCWERVYGTPQSLRIDELQSALAASQAEVVRLRAALSDLFDDQNGPPLFRDAERWQAAYDRANAVLYPEEAHDGDPA